MGAIEVLGFIGIALLHLIKGRDFERAGAATPDVFPRNRGGVVLMGSVRMGIYRPSTFRAVLSRPGKRYTTLLAAYNSHGFPPQMSMTILPPKVYKRKSGLSTFARAIL